MADRAGGRQTADAFMNGFSAALMVASAIALLGAVVAVATVRTHIERAPQPVPEAG
jgi:hypothetical protein